MEESHDGAGWTERLREMQSDPARLSHNETQNRERRRIVPEMRDLLERFQGGSLTVEELRAEFDTRTRNEWDYFGFKGMSGAMFLNMLVKRLSEADLSAALRKVLALPQSPDEGEQRMRGFEEYLEAQIESGVVLRSQIQPARVPFLISGLWHIQDQEAWPVFYQSGRATLRQEGLLLPSGEGPITQYFRFRTSFLRLATHLHVDSWTCEHLLDWMDQKAEPADPPPPIVIEPTPVVIDATPDLVKPVDDAEEASHTHLQWLLTKIGRALKCQVWVAANDRNRAYRGERLGEECISDLPHLGLDDDSQRIVRLIDVVWIRGERQIAAAFEIEHTTSIYSGLLRMSDLAALSPNLSFPLYIVAPEARMGKVEEQLKRPTFEALGLDRLCGFFSNETLIAEADGIIRWAHDPSAIRRIAKRVGGD
ncbi:MAG TPA: hypothetical protein VGN57_20060 [Pirellulaceae bacterium]|jgi:hypothetical protein|nr:hypothetical protein [Pirellulaceae bacterium]